MPRPCPPRRQANRLAAASQRPEALAAVERALTTARESGDRVGEARAHRGRALFLARLGRGDEGVAAWREAAAAWERVGDGPGQVEALAAAAGLLEAQKPREAEPLTARALALGRAEIKRPLAAAQMLD